MRIKLVRGLMVTLFLVSMLSTAVSVSAQIPGDINDDGTVDILDGVVIGIAFGSETSGPNWNPDADIAEPWGLIDVMDVLVWALNFGKTG